MLQTFISSRYRFFRIFIYNICQKNFRIKYCSVVHHFFSFFNNRCLTLGFPPVECVYKYTFHIHMTRRFKTTMCRSPKVLLRTGIEPPTRCTTATSARHRTNYAFKSFCCHFLRINLLLELRSLEYDIF